MILYAESLPKFTQILPKSAWQMIIQDKWQNGGKSALSTMMKHHKN
jgi:hypothetical protein